MSQNHEALTHDDVKSEDMLVTTYEQLMIELLQEDSQLALNGLLYAYEVALKNRYPYKEIK